MTDKEEIEREIEQLAAGAGLALQAWTQVELMLTFLFVGIMDRGQSTHPLKGQPWHREPPQRRVAHQIFNSVIGFDARLDILRAAINEGGVSPELALLWPPLEARLRKKYKSRHEAAHFLIEIEENDNGRRAFLFPFATTMFEQRNKKLTRANLDHKAAQFKELGEALYWYRDQIERDRGRRSIRPIEEPALIQRLVQSLERQ